MTEVQEERHTNGFECILFWKVCEWALYLWKKTNRKENEREREKPRKRTKHGLLGVKSEEKETVEWITRVEEVFDQDSSEDFVVTLLSVWADSSTQDKWKKWS